jgi:hypothetical protein
VEAVRERERKREPHSEDESRVHGAETM